MKNLSELKLNPKKMLSYEELLNFKGGVGGTCSDCVSSAEIGCGISCESPTNGMSSSGCYVECVLSQADQCFSMYGDPALGCA